MKLPLLATRGVIVFPKHKIRLDVGRKESLKALEMSSKEYKNKILVVSQKVIMDDKIKSTKELFKVGTLVTFTEVESFPNGSKTIEISGLERVSISKIDFSSKALIADYKIIKSFTTDEEKERTYVERLSSLLDSTLSSMINVPKSVLSSLATGINASELVDVVGQYLPLSFKNKQKVLAEVDVNRRLILILDFILEQKEMSNVEKDIENNVKKTIDNQHREFLLRERMKAIKEELGEISSKESDVDKWRKMIEEDKKFPKRIKEQVLEEIKKFESTPQMAAESNVIKGHLETIFSLPWETYSKDNEDISAARKVLDKHHYGLKKVKERIVEYLAVKMNTKNAKSPIITLVGPPGVGKTSLAKSIAEAMSKKFIKVSLGGVRDEAEIRGHRRTYVASMPGKIINAIKKAGVSNPIILLDEIDKLSSDPYKGDPTSAMLEVLDPEQNKAFQDHYLELEYDLSQVMFLGTANYYNQIPEALLDRVEIIFLDQYTSEEKLEIAKNYIIPKSIKEHGLAKNMFKISDSTILYLINKYTIEAGVRGLQKVINKLCRKIVLSKLSGKLKTSLTLTQERAHELLGKEEVHKEKLSGKKEVGLVNGMYYSSVGGGVLPIEVTIFKSKNPEIKLTGSIKDVMKESLKIAVGYIRANQKKFGINFDWDSHTVQIHVPEGATPKDGPSAGIAFTTAIISSLSNKPVPRDIALTGEITLRGKVLPIGGLREKSLGAVELGVKKIFHPKANEKDYDDLSKKVKDVATLYPVDDYEQVFKLIFS